MKKSISIILVAYFCLEVCAALSPSQKAWLSVADTEPAVADTTGYLIVSTPKYREPIKKFMEWKRTLGFQVDTLIETWTQTDTASIRSIIRQRYNANPNLGYLLIVGDADDVPTFHKSIRLNTKKYDLEGRFSKDIWDYASDYEYGLIDSPSDIPILKRGRISVNTKGEANIVFDKIIGYEASPVMDADFYKTGLQIAQFQNISSYGGRREGHRFTQTSEEIRNHLLSHEKNVKRMYKSDVDPFSGFLFWNDTIYSNGGIVPDSVRLIMKSSISSGEVEDSINAGSFYTLYFDHAGSDEWQTTGFSNSNISALHNGDRLPLVISCCCYSGKFPDDCMAEAFLKKENGGSIGVIASTEIILTGFSDAFLEGMFSSIWPENGISISSLHRTILNTIDYSGRTPVYRLGDILDSGLAAMRYQFNGVSMYGLDNYVGNPQETADMGTYVCGIFHLFGDPVMELRTEVPQRFSAPTISVVNDSIHVGTSDGDARISFYDVTTGAVCSYLGSTAGYACNSGDKVKVSLTRPNYIPYIAEVGGDIYIQNETILGGRVYRGGDIYVGKDVTSAKDSGEVVFRSGSETTLKGGTVKLDKGIRIEKGAILSINN